MQLAISNLIENISNYPAPVSDPTGDLLWWTDTRSRNADISNSAKSLFYQGWREGDRKGTLCLPLLTSTQLRFS